VKRRVCESCYFYEAAGIVNSGWCRHPDRQFSTGVRLVVRGNELNCRNGWDSDLWVPAGIEPGASDNLSDDWESAEHQDDQITSIVPARYESQETPPEIRAVSDDVVVRHDPYADYAPPEKEARDLVTNPRAAILKAREQFKVRQLREGRIADRVDRPILADPLDDFSDVSDNGNYSRPHDDQDDRRRENAPFLGAGASSAPRPPEYTVPPVSREEMNRPYVTITHFPEDDRRFESLPDEIAGGPAHRSEPPVQQFQAEPEAIASIQDDGYDDWQDDSLMAENGWSEGPARPRRRSFFGRLLGDRRQHRQIELDDREYGPDRYPQYADSEDGEYYYQAEDLEPRLPEPRHYPEHGPSSQSRDFHPEWEGREELADEPSHRHSPDLGAPSRSLDFQAETAIRTVPPEREAPAFEPRRSHYPEHQPTSEYYGTLYDSSGEESDWEFASYDERESASYDEREHAIFEEREYVYRGPVEDHFGTSAGARDGQYTRQQHVTPSWERADAFQENGHEPVQQAGTMDELPRWNSAEYGVQEYQQPAPVQQRPRPIAPDLPQICRTCRDFRPSESGDRGWCNNAYAFRHRRMVDADVLSCESSFGNWWIAHDGVWQKAADVSRHALETPLLDRLLGIGDHTDTPSHRSGSGR
jgi:hypothetical protein